MPQTDLDVCNLAITTKASGEAIASFTQNTPLASMCARAYPQKRSELLAAHRWVFAKRVVQLTRIATPAGCPYTYAYAYPSGRAGEFWDFRVGADPTSCKVSVLQLEAYIASEDATVWAEFTGDTSEASWPPYFTALVACAFGVDVARACMRRSLADDLLIEAFGNPEDHADGGLMLKAKQLDSVNAPKRSLEYDNGGPLVAARSGIGLPTLGLLQG